MPAATTSSRLGEPLPKAREASIAPSKLHDYALDESHPVGRHKAAVFRSALGITHDDWRHLWTTMLEQLPTCPVTGVRASTVDDGSSTWEVLVLITGLETHSGRTLNVITAWEITDGRPVLTCRNDRSGVAEREHHALVEVVTDDFVGPSGLPARTLAEDLIAVPYTELAVVASPSAAGR